MVEVLGRLEQLAKKEQDTIQWTSDALAGEPERLLFVASQTCSFVKLLQLLWGVIKMRFRNGGVHAKWLVQECDLLINHNADVEQRLAVISRDWPERGLSNEVGQPIYNDVQAARRALDSLARDVSKVRERAATPPRVSADPEELKRRTKQADDQGEWVKLADAVSRLRQGASSSQE